MEQDRRNGVGSEEVSRDAVRGLRLEDAVASAVLGTWVLACMVCRLSAQLNPHLLERRSDVLLLLGYQAAFYCLGGALIGLGTWLVAARLVRGRPALVRVVLGWLLVTPILGGLLLPDLGLAGSMLTDLLMGDLLLARLARLAILGSISVLVAVVVGLGSGAVIGLVATRSRASQQRVASILGVAVALMAALITQLPVESRAAPDAAGAAEPPSAQAGDVSPVVLLCVDGADLDDVVLPMIERGELPALASMRRQGAWGALESMEPGLSAVLWTTIATGQPPEVHGIWHFVAARLPGMRQAIHRFPLHTGFNFHLLGLAERLPGDPSLRLPYTSNMRRARALWDVVGDHYPVGVYRWLVTWPAEPVNGFNVAESVVAGIETRPDLRRRMLDAVAPDDPGSRAAFYPPELLSGFERDPAGPIGLEELAAYVDPGCLDGPSDPHARFLMRSLRSTTLDHLVWLRARHQPMLTMASFYSVDGFCHRYASDWVHGGCFADAVPERYRELDRRLAALMASLDPGTNLIVVSDHGFDFEHNHHTYGPDGIFLAMGPAFARGREVVGLSLFDIAPLCLRLLGLPLAEDMAGTQTGRYRQALDPGFAEGWPERRIATYERHDAGCGNDHEPLTRGDEEKVREQLRELGYIE